jgi:predicted RecB family nuclease
MDAFGNPADREEPNPFIELLWERGSLFERDTIAKLGEPFTDLSTLAGDDKEHATREAMSRGDVLIYNGRLSEGELLGQPDLLRREGLSSDGRALYVAIDIKSGAGEEGGSDGDDDDGKPKKTYGVQVSLYTDILIRMDASAGRYAYIWDIHGAEVRYDLDAALGPKTLDTLWSIYLRVRNEVSQALERAGVTRGASSSACKLCAWHSACLRELRAVNDLTLLPELGRVTRDSLCAEFPNIIDLAGANVDRYIDGKKTRFPRVGADTLRKFHARAGLATSSSPAPYLKRALHLPVADTELFFDIETDPMRDLCYLHGFVMRDGRDNKTERFFAFFAEDITPAAERDAFAAAWAFLEAHVAAAVYIYSKYERTIYRKLAQRYPDVCRLEAVERLFAPTRTLDLYYDVVKPATEWPTLDFSIKSIAKALGFEWRDKHPSGAASIQWFDEYIKSRSAKDKQRILDYNEDDCRAMRVLVDALQGMPVRTACEYAGTPVSP